ncbi:MAG: cysteine--tRNA ligase [archaeon]
MVLKLYNTRTWRRETFKPLNGKTVKMYTCGPTVYWFAHVGNMRSYIFADVLKRVLVYNGFKVKHVINVTDVGHLTSDSDTGKDKLEISAKKEGKSAKEISEFYFKAFLTDFKKLNLLEPDYWPKATAHIKEQIDLIKILEKKGYTYKTSDGIYFDSSKFKDYGKFSRKKILGLEAGKRVEMKEKKNVSDFALWKFSSGEGRLQEWDSLWGIGFPGWHIECSAMSSKYLGKQFDIHTGAEDLIPVHHENEIAQSEVAFGKSPWVNFWMHGAFLEIRGGKMSKSKGKVKTISELEKDGIDPLAYKYFTYTAHYRKPLTWSEEALSSAISSFTRLKNIVLELKDDGKSNSIYLKKFKDCVNDDLDMPGAVAVLWNFLRDEKASGKFKTIKEMDSVFGLELLKKENIKIPLEIKRLGEERAKARREKDWKQSDELRSEIEKKGWTIKDGPNSYSLEKT